MRSVAVHSWRGGGEGKEGEDGRREKEKGRVMGGREREREKGKKGK